MGWLLGTLVLVLVLSYLGRRLLGARVPLRAPSLTTAAHNPPTPEPLGDTLDLHGVPPRDVTPLVDAFLEVNLMMLCHAITEANRGGMSFELWLYGKGNEKKDLLAFSEHSSGQVKVFDIVPNEQIPEILARAHVGTLPFPDEEKYRVSSPIKLFE